MQNITQEDIGVFLSVLKWSEGCWNYPKGIKHCYNCARANACENACEKVCSDEYGACHKRIRGLVDAAMCKDYIYNPGNHQASQNIDLVSQKKLAIFFKVLRAFRENGAPTSPNSPRCKGCPYINVCNYSH